MTGLIDLGLPRSMNHARIFPGGSEYPGRCQAIGRRPIVATAHARFDTPNPPPCLMAGRSGERFDLFFADGRRPKGFGRFLFMVAIGRRSTSPLGRLWRQGCCRARLGHGPAQLTHWRQRRHWPR